ncbi:hypothetical protein HYH03_017561 [Edaphochlamys debaryana]|uniref:Uncharacterized protein n=1 Tax=Edaphochlamys debaryana TaxID=47281 RepID=A0A835XHL8_9CHLO|nr:hypothetical protein HYH03_017561 [Edaphochlamys debaryana]|eukprot:KAG2483554.1 hypothetical protein HYH03_017561 [Edaphochlamys debaryana]
MAAAARVPQPLLRRPTAAVRSQHLCPRHGARQAHAPPPACLPLAAPPAAGRRTTAAAAAASPLGGGGGGKELAQERQAPVEPWRRIAAGVISLLVGAGLLLFLLWLRLVLPNWPAWKGNVPLPIVWAAAAAVAAGVAAVGYTVIKCARTWVFGQVPSDVDKPRPADAPRLEHPASPPLPDDARNVPATAGQVDDVLAVLKEQAADVKKQAAVLKEQAADVKKVADNYDELTADMGAIAEATAGQALRQTLGAEVVGGRKVLRNANSLVVALVPHVPGYGAAVYVAAEECLVSYLMANGHCGFWAVLRAELRNVRRRLEALRAPKDPEALERVRKVRSGCWRRSCWRAATHGTRGSVADALNTLGSARSAFAKPSAPGEVDPTRLLKALRRYMNATDEEARRGLLRGELCLAALSSLPEAGGGGGEEAGGGGGEEAGDRDAVEALEVDSLGCVWLRPGLSQTTLTEMKRNSKGLRDAKKQLARSASLLAVVHSILRRRMRPAFLAALLTAELRLSVCVVLSRDGEAAANQEQLPRSLPLQHRVEDKPAEVPVRYYVQRAGLLEDCEPPPQRRPVTARAAGGPIRRPGAGRAGHTALLPLGGPPGGGGMGCMGMGMGGGGMGCPCHRRSKAARLQAPAWAQAGIRPGRMAAVACGRWRLSNRTRWWRSDPRHLQPPAPLPHLGALGHNTCMVPVTAGRLYSLTRFKPSPWRTGFRMAFSSVSVLASALLLSASGARPVTAPA